MIRDAVDSFESAWVEAGFPLEELGETGRESVAPSEGGNAPPATAPTPVMVVPSAGVSAGQLIYFLSTEDPGLMSGGVGTAVVPEVTPRGRSASTVSMADGTQPVPVPPAAPVRIVCASG